MSKETQPLVITLPKRGLRVIPPPETASKMEQAARGQKITPFSENEKYRLRKMVSCTILQKRYPTVDEGKKYMEEVDYGWREVLLQEAMKLTSIIVESWRDISSYKDIAIILYGSIAKGLVRRPDHPDPSNIDITVLGSITDEEKVELFERIRPARQETQRFILSQCPVIDSPEGNPGNAGVIIQDFSKLVADDYEQTRRYISSGATSLYDPAGIWTALEAEAINFALTNTTKRGKKL